MKDIIDQLKKFVHPDYVNEIDFNSIIDNTLTFSENLELLRERYGYAFKAIYITKTVIKQSPKPKTDYLPQDLSLNEYAKMAYFGGRIELFKRGLIQDIYHYDINSAYPYAMTKIPNLNGVKWDCYNKIHESDLETDSFGIVYTELIDGDCIVGALPFRYNSGYVVFPQKAKGYYHIVEVLSAINKGYNVKFGDGIILRKPYTYPFKEYIINLMQKRLKYKESGDFAHIPLKLGANSFYGKLAQKPSMYKNKCQEPKYRDLLMAGFITAHTRAQLLQYLDPISVILTATDAIYSLSPLTCKISNNLGDWEYNFHDSGIFILAGIYSLNNNGVWNNKIRGFKDLDILNLWQYIQKYPYDSIPLTDRRFLGIKYCLGLTNKAKDYKMCNFVDIPREIDWNNNRKRIFLPNNSSFATNDLNNQTISVIYKDKLLENISNIIQEDSALSECNT